MIIFLQSYVSIYNRQGRSTWVCSKHHKYGNSGCKAKPIFEDELVEIINEALELTEFNRDIFKEIVEKIKITESKTVIIILKDGSVIKKGMI